MNNAVTETWIREDVEYAKWHFKGNTYNLKSALKYNDSAQPQCHQQIRDTTMS